MGAARSRFDSAASPCAPHLPSASRGMVAVVAAAFRSQSSSCESEESADGQGLEDPSPAPVLPLPGSGAGRLVHLDGARALMALWIVYHHLGPKGAPSVFDGIVLRVDVCVEMFALLSGFLMQRSHGRSEFTSPGSLAAFYVRRLFRVLLVTFVGMAWSLLFQWFASAPLATLHNFMCFLFLKTWIEPRPDCPDMASWFVCSMLPCWLLYPLVTRPLLRRARGVLPLLAVALWCLAIGPSLALMAARGGWLSWRGVQVTWFWPPALLPDFALGACCAELARERPASALLARLGDAALALALLLCLLLPIPSAPEGWRGPAIWRPGHYVRWDQLSARAAAPLLALWLYASASGRSAIAARLSHPGLTALGAHAMEVYLFQLPLHDVFLWLRPPAGPWRGLPWTCDVFLAYLALLWCVAGLFGGFVADPLEGYVKAKAATWERSRYHSIEG